MWPSRHRPLLLIHSWAIDACVPSNLDSNVKAFGHNQAHGLIGHAFIVYSYQKSKSNELLSFVPYKISILVELILGHLHYLLTDVLPQPISPPDNVFYPNRLNKVGLRPSRRGSALPSDSWNKALGINHIA
ncbi:uncharacterized protein LOC111302007 [Durio zibethinus]|uniref:Uncharacterized protein LOC111302007 n=1 Tax=Durio zibethinus TaxID=66656 RepID=A0A6P5ZMY1_DURZI|nr:uncharacterized protein LOC111302007 [Durio zibethinus]